MTHYCLVQRVNEVCPFCQHADRVFLGHGEVRHCERCTMSWDHTEDLTVFEGASLPTLGVAFEEADFTEATMLQKVESLPPEIRTRVNQTTRALVQATAAGERAQRVRTIPIDEWDEALAAEEPATV